MCEMRPSLRNAGRNSCGNCRGRFHLRRSAALRLNAIKDESDRDRRPGAGAAPGLKAGPPHTKRGFSPARRFRRTGRSLTQWRNTRRIQTTGRKGGGDIRAEWLALRAATGLANSGSFRGQSLPEKRGASDAGQQEGRKADPSSPPNDGATGQNGVNPTGFGAGNPSMSPEASGGASAPDVSAEFRSEMAAIRAYYAARIAAARRGLPAGDIAAAIRALLNEETVALRALTDRWRAATERQQQEKPQRPAGNARRKDDGPKPS